MSRFVGEVQKIPAPPAQFPVTAAKPLAGELTQVAPRLVAVLPCAALEPFDEVDKDTAYGRPREMVEETVIGGIPFGAGSLGQLPRGTLAIDLGRLGDGAGEKDVQAPRAT